MKSDLEERTEQVLRAGVSRRSGSWPDTIGEIERRALQAITRLCCGPRGAQLAYLLRQAEHDPAALVPALAELDRLASLNRRRVLASYSALGRSAA